MRVQNRFFHFMFSIFAAATLIVAAAPFSYAVFVPSSNFPYAESLPFGYNCAVIDVRYSETTWYRYYVPYNTTFYLAKPGILNTNATLVLVLPQMLGADAPANNRIYYQTHDSKPTFSSLRTINITNQITNDYYAYQFQLSSYITQSTYQFQSNYSSLISNDYWGNTLQSYPTSQNQIVSRVNDNVNNQVSSLNAQESRRAATELSQESKQHADDMTQRSQQHSEIMNAGSDISDLDTNNDWMDDSLSKVNGWLDDISGFEQQMSANRVANAENLSNASSLISTFFDRVPGALVAALALGLVMIVVVKIVGR